MVQSGLIFRELRNCLLPDTGITSHLYKMLIGITTLSSDDHVIKIGGLGRHSLRSVSPHVHWLQDIALRRSRSEEAWKHESDPLLRHTDVVQSNLCCGRRFACRKTLLDRGVLGRLHSDTTDH